MIESELIYLNDNIQKNVIDYKEYQNILDKIDEHISREENPESLQVKLLKGVKEFLLEFPLDCLKDISVGPGLATISYDCIKSDKRIGTYGLIVNFEYWTANAPGADGQTRFDTSFEINTHNKKKQYTVGWKDLSNQRMEMNTIKEDCLLNNWNNLELYQRLRRYTRDFKFDEEFIGTVTRELYNALNNKYLQVFYSPSGEEEYVIELTPKVIMNNKYAPSSLKLEYNDDGDVVVYLKAGVEPSKSDSFYVEQFHSLMDEKEDWEKEFNKKIQEIVKAVRDSKSLLYSYSINSFSNKIFSNKEIK